MGFWEIENKPTQLELQQYYAERYYQEARGSYESEYSPDELSYFNAKLEQRFAVLQCQLPNNKSRPRMLDVGCGEGFALKFFREQGWTVKGFDFSSRGLESNNPDCLDALVTGDVFSLLNAEIESNSYYDVVWLQNVLEHVLDPLELLGQLRGLVGPRGIAVVTVPNDCSVIQRTALSKKYIDNAFWVSPPDHLSYFDNDSLIAAANHTGWECFEMLADFPIDWFLYNPHSNYVREESVGKAAHKARLEIENLIHRCPIKDAIQFWSSAAKVGIGRDITAFLRPLGAI